MLQYHFFEEQLISTTEYEINDDFQVFDHYLYNSEGYWDWYEVGGRWDNYFENDNEFLCVYSYCVLHYQLLQHRIHDVEENFAK